MQAPGEAGKLTAAVCKGGENWASFYSMSPGKRTPVPDSQTENDKSEPHSLSSTNSMFPLWNNHDIY